MPIKKKRTGSVKQIARNRRSGRASARISLGSRPRLRVRRSNSHISVQLQSPDGSQTLAQVSTQDKDFTDYKRGVARSASATQVGQRIAEKAKKLGVEEVAFDRGGYKYHGVIRFLADAAREHGLKF